MIGDRRIELGVKGGNVTNSNGGGRLPSVTGLPWNAGWKDGKRGMGPYSEIVFSAAPDTIPEPKDSSHRGYRGNALRDVQGACPMGSGREFTGCVLDGRTESSGVSVAFKNIASIKSLGNSSLVTLHSGRELYMWGENDVNATNRGIAINLPSVGQVIVGWHDFKLFRSIPLDQLNLPVYDDFAGSRTFVREGGNTGRTIAGRGAGV